MRPRGSFRRWLRALALNVGRGSRRDGDLRADIESYLDLLTDEKVAAGLTPEAARRAALLEFGSVAAVTEETRSARAGALLDACAQDARYSLRMIRRDPGFSIVAVITLALGIGANTAIFTLTNAVLLRPLPYPDPDRLVLAWERNNAIGKLRDPVAPANYLDWRAQNTTFDALGAYRFVSFALGNVPDPEQLNGLSLSASVFRVLQAAPQVGRVFTDEEERRRDPVVVLAHELWQRRFGGDRGVVGRSITLNDAMFTVVGVMPPRFGFPDGHTVDLYSPLRLAESELTTRLRHSLIVIGRLKGDATIDRARTDLATIARRIASEDRTSNPAVTLAGAHEALVEDVQLVLRILSGTVSLVLLIACANVANLLLVRASSRRREMAMRAALGAGRGRLVRQLLTESVVLAALGGAAGALVGWCLVASLQRFRPANVPRLDEVGIDTTVLLFVAVLALGTGLLFGLIPALQAATPRLADAVRSTSDGAPARSRARAAVVVGEVALSLVLLAGAGLMLRTLFEVQQLHHGFEPDDVLTAQLLLPSARYPIDARQYRAGAGGAGAVLDSRPYVFFARLQEQLKGLPGVESAGAVSALPLDRVGTDYDLPVVVVGKPQPPPGQEPQADFRVATTGYFRTMRIPLLRGRDFEELDGPGSAPVVVINETMARQLFAGDNPVGQHLVLYGGPRRIVGVVGAVRHRGFDGDPRPEMYLPYRQFQFGGMTLAVRSRLEPNVLATAVRQAVHAVDPQLPVHRVRTMNDFLADSAARPRLTAVLLAGFAAAALILALVGVYGVTSHAVSHRAREIAIRIALGARRHDVVRLVARQSVRCILVGVAIGFVGAAMATRLMAGLLFGVSATDPFAFVGAATALGVTALAGTYVPALRAARVAAATVLRAE